MPTGIRVGAGELGPLIQSIKRGARQSIDEGMMIGAQRSVSYLKRISPVYDGLFRAAWKCFRTSSTEVQIRNDAPYAGVLEAGARPHKVSKEGQEALRQWIGAKLIKETRVSMRGPGRGKQGPKQRVVTRGGLTKSQVREGVKEQEIEAILHAILTKLAKKGQPGKHFVKNAMPKILDFVRAEVKSRFKAFLTK